MVVPPKYVYAAGANSRVVSNAVKTRIYDEEGHPVIAATPEDVHATVEGSGVWSACVWECESCTGFCNQCHIDPPASIIVFDVDYFLY